MTENSAEQANFSWCKPRNSSVSLYWWCKGAIGVYWRQEQPFPFVENSHNWLKFIVNFLEYFLNTFWISHQADGLNLYKALCWVWFLNNCSKYNHYFRFIATNKIKETYTTGGRLISPESCKHVPVCFSTESNHHREHTRLIELFYFYVSISISSSSMDQLSML